MCGAVDFFLRKLKKIFIHDFNIPYQLMKWKWGELFASVRLYDAVALDDDYLLRNEQKNFNPNSTVCANDAWWNKFVLDEMNLDATK